MEDSTLQFALIGATIVGTVIAVLVGRALDKGEKGRKVIGLLVPKNCQIIDFSKKNILLAPTKAPSPLEKIFEMEIGIGNVGFAVVTEFSVTVKTTFAKEFEKLQDFVDYSIETYPDGMKYEIREISSILRENVYSVNFPFMNRGDRFLLRTISSSEFQIQCTAHHQDTELVYTADLSPLPTLRQRIASGLSQTKHIEWLIGAVGAAATAAGLTFIGM